MVAGANQTATAEVRSVRSSMYSPGCRGIARYRRKAVAALHSQATKANRNACSTINESGARASRKAVEPSHNSRPVVHRLAICTARISRLLDRVTRRLRSLPNYPTPHRLHGFPRWRTMGEEWMRSY